MHSLTVGNWLVIGSAALVLFSLTRHWITRWRDDRAFSRALEADDARRTEAMVYVGCLILAEIYKSRGISAVPPHTTRGKVLEFPKPPGAANG